MISCVLIAVLKGFVIMDFPLFNILLKGLIKMIYKP